MPNKSRIYLDYAATTPLDPAVLKIMNEAGERYYANPSSLHYPGQESKVAIEKARQVIAESIQAKAREIVFTGSGTESNNLALIGAAQANRSKGNHIITTRIEHVSVLECCEYLKNERFRITYLNVNKLGQVDPEELKSSIDSDTILVSVMMANNETGCLLPIKEIGAILSEQKVLFHVDAVQAFGKIDISVQDLKADLLTVSAHKIYGPKGIAALYIGNDVSVERILHGGAQERNRRPGTENITGIIGFSEAVTLMNEKKDEHNRILNLRNYFEHELKQRIPDIRINGDEGSRLYSHSNIYFPFIPGDAMLMSLDIQGIAVSVGSACSSGSQRPSHVLTAMGFEPERINRSVRFSFGRFTSREETEQALDRISEIFQSRLKGIKYV